MADREQMDDAIMRALGDLEEVQTTLRSILHRYTSTTDIGIAGHMAEAQARYARKSVKAVRIETQKYTKAVRIETQNEDNQHTPKEARHG